MVARKSNGLITLLAFHTIFHELEVSHRNLHTDKHGRSWQKVVDPDSNLVCYSCETDKIFPFEPDLEMKIKYI